MERKRNSNQVMTGEILINLPIIKLASTRLHGELNYRSARQLQATLGITQLQQAHTASLSYQLSGSKFTGMMDIESPLLVDSFGFDTSKKSFSFKTNFGDRSAMSFESKMDDDCHLIGSLRIASPVDGPSAEGQINLNCPNWKKTVNLELAAAGAKQGKLVVATGPSVQQQHQFAYKIDRLVEDGGLLQVSISAESPAWIEPLHLQGMWQNGEGSLTARYGRQSHSIRGSYAREGAAGKMTGSIIVASPYLSGAGGEASLLVFYHRMEASVQLDLLGQRHRMEGQLQNWPGLGARFALDSPVLPWQSLVINARAEHDHDTDAKINVTCNYGGKNLIGLAGRARYAAWNDLGGFLELTTPFRTLPTARLDANFVAPNARRINVTVNIQTSSSFASFNAQYHFTPTQLDSSATLKTPFARWEEVGVKITVPLTLSPAKHIQMARLTATMPTGTRYSAVASLHFPLSWRQLDAEVELDCGSPARKFSARVLLKADDIYQARVEVTTPVRGFENYLWDLKGQADVKRWGESSAFLDWNGER